MSSGNSEEENILPVVPSDEALEEANNYIKEAFDILKRETIKVRKEKEAFDEVAKKIEHVHFSKMVMLNVGGHFFSTSLSTLNKDPGMFQFQIIWFLTCRWSDAVVDLGEGPKPKLSMFFRSFFFFIIIDKTSNQALHKVILEQLRQL